MPTLFWTSKTACNKIDSNDFLSDYEPKSAPPLFDFYKKKISNSITNENSEFIFSGINNYTHEKPKKNFNFTSTTSLTFDSLTNTSSLKPNQLLPLTVTENSLTKNNSQNLINMETPVQNHKLYESEKFNLSNDVFSAYKLNKTRLSSNFSSLINLKNRFFYKFLTQVI